MTEGLMVLQRSQTKVGCELYKEENEGCESRIIPQLQKETLVRLAALHM